MKKLALISSAAVLILVGAGCSSAATVSVQPTTPPPAAAPTAAPAADGFVSSIRAQLSTAQITYTEKSEMDSVAKMATKASITDAIKFKAPGASVLVVTVGNASDLAAVKAEIEGQYKTLQTLSATVRIVWLAGDTTHLAVVNYKAEDEAAAQKVLAALGATAQAPTPAAAVATKFKLGDKVEARWHGGSYYKGTVAAIAADGTYSINYDDGDKETGVAEVNINLQVVPTTQVQVQVEPVNGTAFKVGDKVLANWKGGSRWWEAKVTGIDGPAISVKYDSDSTTDALGPLSVSHYPSGAAKVVVGSKVVAKWTNGSYYGGTITAVNGAKATVKWNDSSAPLDVALTDIVLQGK